MKRIEATSKKSIETSKMVQGVQQKFVRILESVSNSMGCDEQFQRIEWYREAGRFGGGIRYIAPKNDVFNSGSVNYSQVQYESDDNKTLRSATAISTIIHPKNPKAPSFHMHVSYTEMKTGEGYWRVMADLNPSISNEKHTSQFLSCIKEASGNYFEEGCKQGDRYFYIPSLERHRGACHFYLENFNDDTLVGPFAEQMIQCYGDILKTSIANSAYTQKDIEIQLDYHTLYFYQVLTLDRGTTSGLLVHNQNDIGVLASLPSHINRELLTTWVNKSPTPQDKLVNKFLDILPKTDICLINNSTKKELANELREHYKEFPEALKLQASGNIIPPTVQNHV